VRYEKVHDNVSDFDSHIVPLSGQIICTEQRDGNPAAQADDSTEQ
jgi:hypothetical protein